MRNNIVRCLVVALIILVVCSMGACSSTKHPSTEQIKKDISSIEEIIYDNDNTWEVVAIEELRAKELDHAYETSVEVKLKNHTYSSAYKKIDLEYSYYEKGGWILEDWDNVTNIYDATPTKGVDEDKVVSWAKNKYKGTIELTSHNTDLSKGLDTFIFNQTIAGRAWDEKSEIVVVYESDNTTGLWRQQSCEEKQTDFKINDINTWFYYEVGGGSWDDYNDYICYYVKEFNEDTATILVVDIAVNGYDVQGYNFNLLPDDTLHTDRYVCYEMKLASYYFEEEKCFKFNELYKGGHVSVDMVQDGLKINYNNRYNLSTTEDLSSVVSIPAEVKEWINNHLS